jgi:hypothetical protein
MLEELLRRLAEGGVHSYEELAGGLAISPAMLEVMLEDLVRRGYLRAVETSCESGCHGCPAGGCSINGRGRLWSLTEKGARAAHP